jgi:NitT/TauT family transport system substrate-binding protein
MAKLLRAHLRLGAVALAMLAGMSTPYAADAWKHGIVEAKGDSGFLFQAAEGGFAKKLGLDLEMVEFTGGPTALKALIAGELDSLEASPVIAFSAMRQNAAIKIVGCDWPGMTYTLFSSPAVASPADLKGKVIGVSAPGSLPALFAQLALEANNVSGTDVDFANAGSSSNRVRAVSNGVVAAAASSSEFAVDAEKLKVKPLIRGVEATPRFVKVCIMTSSKSISERHADLVKFLAAEMQGLQHALDNKADALALSRKAAKLAPSDKTAEFIYDEAVKYKAVTPDLAIPVENLQWTYDQMLRLGAIKGNVDVTGFVDDGPRREALSMAKISFSK